MTEARECSGILLKSKTALLTLLLGWWLITFVLTFCDFSHGRTPLVISDFVSGFALVAFGLLALTSIRILAGRGILLVAIWLQLAPLFFWADSSATYLNDTLVGAIAFFFSFKITERQTTEKSIAPVPRGWSYNPSSWGHRIPIIGLALVCWACARYMAAYQLGYISQIWDPFFSEGTVRVITSDVSRSFPVSDAGMGALCYTFEALLGCQGDRNRFATMPWVVFSFAFLVIPVGIVSIALIIMQPVIVGAWCSWCLATAICMLLMIMLTAAEFAATLQFLKESKLRKKSLWKVFWYGGSEVQAPGVKAHMMQAVSGVTLPWNLALSALLGLVIILAPSVLYIERKCATNDFIIGPIVIAISVISWAEAFRFMRFCLVPLGAWIILAPLIFSSSSPPVILFHILIGALIFLFALRRGPIHSRYGSWERLIH